MFDLTPLISVGCAPACSAEDKHDVSYDTCTPLPPHVNAEPSEEPTAEPSNRKVRVSAEGTRKEGGSKNKAETHAPALVPGCCIRDEIYVCTHFIYNKTGGFPLSWLTGYESP